MTDKNFIAAKAFIKMDDKILLLRESNAYQDGVNVGFYDVPGGRLEPDENLLSGLAREVKEETGLTVVTAELFFINDIIVQKNAEAWHIKRHFFICTVNDSNLSLSKDHDDTLWINPLDYVTAQIIPNLTEVFAAYNKDRNLS